MRIISIKKLRDFWEQPIYADSEQPLKSWFHEVNADNADWKTPSDLKLQYSSASILKNSRVVFNIYGNKYRLVVSINYAYRVVYIRFIGTHKQYDAIDVEAI
ncbi:MAG: type II toxin-antitoxin system HigB family toxin [Magnetococcales bacterium]|nr:type II toxin-antitoxin system HigB family toxin [Magnetococcales bacterium]